ncbi:MAG: hypothetical protein MR210_08950 [Erysipelotrichaceae bacterium]|nr:hypothetical protein [Erysipelotrichaceae bacterium]MDY5252439.1 hypothetical protein [Erysipelotrichaceae bacterium]
MDKKCFAVTGPFVPANEPMTLLSYKYLRALDLPVEVVALELMKDPSLEEKLAKDPKFSNFHINYVGKYHDALFSIKNVNLFKALYFMHRYVKKAIKAYDDQEIIFTSSFPAYVHRVGLAIKNAHPDVTWVASFSDPINNSPYKNDLRTYKEYSLIEKIAFKTYCKFYVDDQDEIIALENADLLIFICEEQRDFMIQQYLKDHNKLSQSDLLAKAVIFPLNYIEEWDDIIKTRQVPNQKFTLAHFGRVYGLRDATVFIQAVNDLVKNNLLSKDIIIKQFGEFRKSDCLLIKELGLEAYFDIYDKIPYEKCIDEMNKADVLLIFDTIVANDEIQPYLPSKVLEYSLLKKDTLTITCKNSPCYRIAKESNAIVALNEKEDIKIALLKAIDGVSSVLNYDYTNDKAKTALKNMLIKKGIL